MNRFQELLSKVCCFAKSPNRLKGLLIQKQLDITLIYTPMRNSHQDNFDNLLAI